MTPPSRICAAGSAAIARASSCCQRVVDGERGDAVEQQRRRMTGDDARDRAREHRQSLQRIGERGELARPCVAQRDARGDALEVARARELLRERLAHRRLGAERDERIVPSDRPMLFAKRLQQPLPQQPASRRRRARVEQRQQCRRGFAAQRGDDLEVAPCRRVEREMLARRFAFDGAYVRERRLLRRARVAEQRARRAEPEIAVVDAERREILRAEMLRERSRRRCGVEVPRRERARRHAARTHRLDVGAVGHQQLGDVEPLQRRGNLRRRHLIQNEPARREIEPCDAAAMLARIHRDEQAVAPRVEQVRIGEGSRRDDARDAPLDRSLRRRGIADLLADRNRFAVLHQLRQVLLDCVKRHARHRDRRAGRMSARRQRDVEQPRRALRVVVEELVEIAHPVEQQLVRMLGLRAKILLHHRRVLPHVGRFIGG